MVYLVEWIEANRIGNTGALLEIFLHRETLTVLKTRILQKAEQQFSQCLEEPLEGSLPFPVSGALCLLDRRTVGSFSNVGFLRSLSYSPSSWGYFYRLPGATLVLHRALYKQLSPVLDDYLARSPLLLCYHPGRYPPVVWHECTLRSVLSSKISFTVSTDPTRESESLGIIYFCCMYCSGIYYCTCCRCGEAQSIFPEICQHSFFTGAEDNRAMNNVLARQTKREYPNMTLDIGSSFDPGVSLSADRTCGSASQWWLMLSQIDTGEQCQMKIST